MKGGLDPPKETSLTIEIIGENSVNGHSFN